MKPQLSALFLLAGATLAATTATQAQPLRPNVLWITCEDMSPQIGPYGDRYAGTPELDRFARSALRYRTCWSNAPVCAPARTTLISGLYPPSTGSEHMRSMARLPAGFRMFPQYLRDAGYYCTNNNKEDYNLEKPGQVWDESSARAHWRNRRPGQPFFAVFNLQITHESNLRTRPHQLLHDPAKVRVPAYHPDTPEVRHDWAQSYDNIAVMDGQFGERLRELEQAGLAEDTVVFFFSDHGSGMPRGKRCLYDSGLRVPLLVRIPERFASLRPTDYTAGGETQRLVSFVDFAPTALSLIGLRSPAHFQGRAFLGEFRGEANDYVHGFRGRMDERYDFIRAVRDRRYVYVRHFMPHLPYGQHVAYMFETPTTAAWKRLHEAGRLSGAQNAFWLRKPVEELYLPESDPDEVRNLAADAAHGEALARLRGAARAHALRIRDVGFLPENEIHARSGADAPYTMGLDDRRYPVERVMQAAEQATDGVTGVARIRPGLRDSDSAVRYWSALGLLIRGKGAVQSGEGELRSLLADPAPAVRVVAAEALGRFGDPADLGNALDTLLALAPIRPNGIWVSTYALNALDRLDEKCRSRLEAIRSLDTTDPSLPARASDYPKRLVEHLVARLQR